jgi:alkylation response protein AidB-like acyl-CoA dehydrogenase
MDNSFTPEHDAFRAEVRDWIEANFPEEIRAKQKSGQPLTKEEMLSWHRRLYAKGWLTPSWPERFGGTGWDVVRRYIFSEELARRRPRAVVRPRHDRPGDLHLRHALSRSSSS